MPELVGWRCFPWAPRAKAGELGSAAFVATGQTGGRFDLGDDPPVRYLASTPEHAVAEVLQAFRGRVLDPHMLVRFGQPLAVVEVRVHLAKPLADLDDPVVLARLALRPSELAHPDRRVTQAAARLVHRSGAPGFSWWSRFRGDWNSRVLFLDRVKPGACAWGKPAPLSVSDAIVMSATQELGIRTA